MAMVIISDSVEVTGLEDGEYIFGGVPVILKDGIVRTKDSGALAGSTSNLLDCVRCAISFGIPEKEAFEMASETPAKLMGLNKGKIEIGFDADFITVDKDLKEFIRNALSPAKDVDIYIIDQKDRHAVAVAEGDNLSLAIGKNGNNIKLATMLTGYTIDVFRNDVEVDEEDIYLDEFSDEIDGWIIDVLKGIGCDTAKNVLALTREELIQRSDLEEETVDEVLAVLKAEFED